MIQQNWNLNNKKIILRQRLSLFSNNIYSFKNASHLCLSFLSVHSFAIFICHNLNWKAEYAGINFLIINITSNLNFIFFPYWLKTLLFFPFKMYKHIYFMNNTWIVNFFTASHGQFNWKMSHITCPQWMYKLWYLWINFLGFCFIHIFWTVHCKFCTL